MKSDNKVLIIIFIIIGVVIIFCVVVADSQIKSMNERMEQLNHEYEQRNSEINEFKKNFKSLSCEQMREEIFNESIPLGLYGWAQEMYKWKPCHEVVLVD